MWPNLTDRSYIDLILGPMFAGKTSHLINIYNYCIKAGFKALVLNHSLDTRYGTNVLSTHDKISVPCIQVTMLSEIFETNLKAFNEADVILINEGQFFEDLVTFCIYCTEHIKKPKQIHVAGLDGDFERKKFGKILELIPYCNSVTKLTPICRNCNNGISALFTHRISSESEQTCIGTNNYISLCRDCYISKTKHSMSLNIY